MSQATPPAAVASVPKARPYGQDPDFVNVKKEDQTNISRTLGLLFHGATVQIRYMSPDKQQILVGYYDDYTVAAQAAKKVDGQGNVFVSLHSISSYPADVTTSYCNNPSLQPTYGKDVCIKAANVDFYNYFFVDIDPVKSGGENSSATKAEARACVKKAKDIRSWLMTQLKFPDPYVALSGNGIHLLWPVNFTIATGRAAYKTALSALAQRYDDTSAVVDTSVTDAVRSAKVYGTLACKGTPTKDRPHRRSRLLHAPQNVKELSLAKLKTLAGLYKVSAQPGAKKAASNGSKDDNFDPVAFAIEVTKNADPFIDTNTGLPCITVKTSTGEHLTCETEGGRFSDYLLAEAKEREHRYLNAHAFDSFIRTTAAITRLSKIKKEVGTRIIHIKDAIFYNLMNKAHQVVAVTPGKVQVLDPATLTNGIRLKFFESSIAKAQVVPKQANQTTLQEVLDPYLNLSAADQILAIVTIITWFLPHTERAVILLNGPQGTGKSFLSQLIQRIVDPVSHDLPTLPTDIQELQLILSQYYLVAFDNVSRIKEDISNVLCKAVTGGTQIKRKLFTNDNLSVMTYKNSIILNGISDFIQMPDLLDRVVALKTRPHGVNRSKQALLAAFQQDLPDIMAKIFDTLAQAMLIYPTVEISTPTRLVEYEKWGYAIAQVLYGNGACFLEAYYHMRYLASTDRAQDDPVASVFLRYATLQTNLPTAIPSRDLYHALSLLAKGSDTRQPAGWPRDASALTSKLERLLVNIQDNGYTFAKKRIRKQRHIVIDTYPVSASMNKEEQS